MDDFNLPETVALLERFPASLNALLHDLPAGWLNVREGDGSWSPLEIVGHLIESERVNWLPRARMILESGEREAFPTFARSGHSEEISGRPIGELLDSFARLRAENLSALEALGLQTEDLVRTGRHPKFGIVTLQNLLATWAAHDLTHLHQLSRVMAGRYRPAVGPWTAFLGVMRCEAHGD